MVLSCFASSHSGGIDGRFGCLFLKQKVYPIMEG